MTCKLDRAQCNPSRFRGRLWCATAVIAFTFFGFTLTSAVPVWIDESFIVEYGRVTLAGDADVFGFHQRSDANRPVYLYTVLLERRPPDLWTVLHVSSLSALDFLAGVP